MNNTYYLSTRDKRVRLTASEAILQGLAPDGCLFVPELTPRLDVPLNDLAAMTYAEIAYAVMKLFLGDFSATELKECIALAYDEKFDTPRIAPLKKSGGAGYYLELFHGPTLAFKDMALTILPHLMRVAKKKLGLAEELVILCATSGDTGKAALSGFADVPGVKVIVFYPKDGVSQVQERQMLTQKGENVHVVGVRGNFDDAQTGVKKIFNDKKMKAALAAKNYRFSSANSINIGRLIPQIVYYVHAYARLLSEGAIKTGDEINVCVPTGNFGNILAAYYAKRIGLPIATFICASNENKVLYDFFGTGHYDKNRELILTASPSMDILVSSNLERLIFHVCENDAAKCKELMRSLTKAGAYTLTDEMRARLADFYGGFANEAQTFAAIKDVWRRSAYVLDPHTAVAEHVHGQYVKDGDTRPTVIVSTASPYKFLHSVLTALTINCDGMDELDLPERLFGISAVPIPPAIAELKTATIRHTKVCDVGEMSGMVAGILNL